MREPGGIADGNAQAGDAENADDGPWEGGSRTPLPPPRLEKAASAAVLVVDDYAAATAAIDTPATQGLGHDRAAGAPDRCKSEDAGGVVDDGDANAAAAVFVAGAG